MTHRALPASEGQEGGGRFPLHLQMLAGFAVGLGAGLAANLLGGDAAWIDWTIAHITGPAGQLFLRLLFMLVLPLLFAALVTGVAEMGDLAQLKRVGLRTLAATVALSGISVVLALLVVNLVRPGEGVDPAAARALLAQAGAGAGAITNSGREGPGALGSVLDIVPSNPFKAAADDDILAFMVFALAIGIGLVLARSEKTETFERGIEGLLEVVLKLIGLVIRLAPIAVACFMFNLAAAFGAEIVVRLGWYVATVLGALLIQLAIVYPLGTWAFAGVGPAAFFRGVQEAMVMAFATASSNATLPTSLRVAENELRLPRKVSRFVLTIGATANQNGTAIFEGVTVIFLAQFFGVELSWSHQATVLAMCILGGIGTAGVPAGSLPVVALILGMVGVPPAAIGLVLGVDRFLDMARTMLNVTGDLAIATIVAGRRDASGTAAGQTAEHPSHSNHIATEANA